MTILISGAGTGVGKTRVCAAFARAAFKQQCSVQIIKPVQTGVAPKEASDAEIAAKLAGLPSACAYTLRRYRAPLAPLAAAAKQRAELDIRKVIQEILALPPVDLRLIEGAGGVAVPLGPRGWDWVDFAEEVGAKSVILVVADELGAINQARLVCHYVQGNSQKKLTHQVFLNALRTPPRDVAASTRKALEDVATPVSGELAVNSMEPKFAGSVSVTKFFGL